VKNFYEAALKDRTRVANEVVGIIEQDLFEQWKTGESNRSISENIDIVEAIINYLEKTKESNEDKKVKLIESESHAQNTLDANKKTWTNIGILSNLVGKSEKTLEAISNDLEKIYILKTKIEGLEFSKKLIPEIIDLLQVLKTSLKTIHSNISKAIKSYDERLNDRCVEEYSYENIPASVLNDNLIKYYDASAIKDRVQSLLRDEIAQSDQAANVRGKLFLELSEVSSFNKFAENIHESKFMDILEKVCRNEAEMHQNSQEKKVLGINIIKRLKQKYQGKDLELRVFINSLIERSGCYLSFDPNEKLASGDGTQGQNQDTKELTIVIPEFKGEKEFTDKLWEVIQSCKSDNIDKIHRVNVDGEKYGNEIVFINVTNLFPLRYVQDIAFIRDKYNIRLDHPDVLRRKTEVHTEDFEMDSLPNLFLPNPDDLERKAKAFQQDTIPYLLIAKSIKIITREKHPETGVFQEAIIRKDDNGFDLPPEFLGNNFSVIPTKLGEEKFLRVKNRTVSLLADIDQFLHEDKRAVIKKDIQELVAEITDGKSITDPVSIAFNSGGREAIKLLEKLNR